ncbi:uncharacterized protein [Rutidosis leptorrhynchoides]|uniref:uncharacterized protein n=1 Tax=Rutidosis leptorrhynchoides TaxID=125765 RepID=UPI003A99215F
MKKKWNGLVYKNHLWSCATATTVPQFEKAMLDLKKFNKYCWIYLSKIPPARSHFSGRAKTDVLLNNMCEILNRWLVEARDKPIITFIEYVREYMMKRIVNVKKVIVKSEGQLTPGATKLFENIKDEARKFNVLWSGSDQYQVSGLHNEQCVVDLVRRTCACNKWELTGMPCKHAVAALYNHTFNSMDVRVPEEWVDQVYWMDTWKKLTLSHVINVLLPPKRVVSAGRPKKNRRKGLNEDDNITNGTHLSRKGKSTTCGICGEYGHNRRGCTTSSKGAARMDKRKASTASGSGSNKKKKPSNGAN